MVKKIAWYPADDEHKHYKKSPKVKTAKLRKGITPGSVLVLLAGRFRGRRVVFLKQLESGLRKTTRLPRKRPLRSTSTEPASMPLRSLVLDAFFVLSCLF